MSNLLLNPITYAVIAALLPVALLLFYIYRQDSAQPEPARWLWKGVWYGILSAVLVLLVMGIASLAFPMPSLEGTVLGAIIDAFLGAAIPEEAAKFLMLWLLLRKNPYFDEHLDGIVYATCVGLGFAGLENIFYVVGNIESLVSIAVVRGLFSVPGHFFFAVAMGYFFSLTYFKSKTKEEKKKYYLLALFVPMVLHGIFDMLLMFSSVEESLAGLCVMVFLYFVNVLRKKGQEKIQELKLLDEYPNR